MAINAGTAIAYLTLDYSSFSKGLKSAGKEMEAVGGKSTTVSNKMSAMGKTMSGVGNTLTKSVSLPLGGVGAAALKVGVDFESGMAQVKAISGATGKDFEMLRERALEMGRQTKFSASESAEALQYMAMAGWDSMEMYEGLPGVMNLAAASGEDLALVSDIVTDAMTAFGMSASETTRFVDVLSATSASSNTNVAMLGESFKYVAPVAGAMGYEVEDVAVALGLMANSGIKASQSGTALRTLMTNMSKPTKDMQVAMDRLGISLTDGEGNMKTFREVMDDLRKGFGQAKISQEDFDAQLQELNASYEAGNISQEEYEKGVEALTEAAYGAEGAEKAKLAAMLAGKEGMAGLLAVVNATEEDYNKLSGAIDNSTGATQEMVDVMMNTLSGALDILKSSLESAGIEIADDLIPIVRDLAEWLTDLVVWFTNLDDGTKEFIVKAGLLAVALGPVLSLFGNLLTITSKFHGAFSLVGGLLSKGVGLFGGVGSAAAGAGAEIAGAGAKATSAGSLFSGLWGIVSAHPFAVVAVGIGVALVTAYNKCEWFRDGVNAVFSAVGDFFSGLGEKISGWGDKVKGFFDKTNKEAENMKESQANTLKEWSETTQGESKKAWNAFEKEAKTAQDSVDKSSKDFKEKQVKVHGAWSDDVKKKSKETQQQKVKDAKQADNSLQAQTERMKANQERVYQQWQQKINAKMKEGQAARERGDIESWNRINKETLQMQAKQTQMYNSATKKITELSKNAANQSSKSFQEGSKNVQKSVENMNVNTNRLMSGLANTMIQKGREAGENLGKGIGSGKVRVNNETVAMINSTYKTLGQFNKGMSTSGKNAMVSFANGIKSGMSSVSNAISGIASIGKSIADKISKSINGSHAGGLSYVPFDGYVAELHKGERVLTREEAEGYNRGNVGSGGDTFNFYNTQPDPYTYARQMKKAKRELLYDM